MDALFETVLEMSLTASVVIAAVLLFRLLLRRAPKKISYALWSAAGFRLLCPVSFRSVFSLFRIVPKQVTELAPAVRTAEIVPSPLPALTPAAPFVPQTVPPIPAYPVTAAYPAAGSAIEAEEAAEEIVLPAAEAVMEQPVDLWAAFLRIGAVLWICGAAVLALCAVVSYVRMKRKMRTAMILEDGVYQAGGIRSPFLLGYIRPKIYVPYGLEPDTLRYVLCHERIHLRRGDNCWKTLGFAALCIHWFNPLVWLAFRLMTRDMEMSCDERVLAENGQISRAYSMSLLSFATNRRLPVPSPLAFGEGDVRKRIRNVLNWKKPKVWVTVLSALLCLAVVAACAANPKEESFEAETGNTGGVEAEDEVLAEEEPEKSDAPAKPVSALRADSLVRITDEAAASATEDRETLADLDAKINAVLDRSAYSSDSALVVLLHRAAELDCLFSKFIGDGQSAGSKSRTRQGADGIPDGAVTLSLKRDTAEADWRFGKNHIYLLLPSLWEDRAKPVLNCGDGIMTLAFSGPMYMYNSSYGGEFDSAPLFTLLLVPGKSADEKTDLPGAEWLATFETKEDGIFRLYARVETPLSGANAEEWQRMAGEMPGILSTITFQTAKITVLSRNESVFSPDEEAVGEILARRSLNDRAALDEMEDWLALLTEAYDRLEALSFSADIGWQDEPFDVLLARQNYGLTPFFGLADWVEERAEEAANDQWTNPANGQWADPANDPNEVIDWWAADPANDPNEVIDQWADPANDQWADPEAGWSSVKSGPATGSFSEKPGIWPAEHFLVAAEQGWRMLYGNRDYLLGAVLGVPEGDPVLASNDGTVVLSDWHYAYGHYIVVDHGGGVCTLYGNLAPYGIAEVGTELKQGDVLGYAVIFSEMSGQLLAPGGNLIFEVRFNGQVLNPRNVIDWWDDTKDRLAEAAGNTALSREEFEDRLNREKAEEAERQRLRQLTEEQARQAEEVLVRTEELLSEKRARHAEAENLLNAADTAYEAACASKDLMGEQRTMTLSDLDSQRRGYQVLCELSAEAVRKAEEALENARTDYLNAVQEDYAANHLSPDSTP